MSGEGVVFALRIEPELRAAFIAACKARDVTASQMVRAFMRDFVRDNAQGDLLAKNDAKKRKVKR